MITAVLVGVFLAMGLPQLPPPPPARPMPPTQLPPRDPGRPPAPEQAGTAAIRGHVIAADTGRPVRRANVTLVMLTPAASGGTGSGATATPTPISQTITLSSGQIISAASAGMMRPKSATTDAQGAFAFSDLPPGTYRLTASPGQYSAAYLNIAYGAKKPGSPGAPDFGTPIQLGDGQVFDKATVALPRGAAIVGRVVDENGEPLARVQVYTLMYLPGSSRTNRSGGSATTDDLGQFRLFGLPPGEYAVAAEARGNTFVAPNAPPETEDDKIGLLTTYFPAAADEAGAQHVRTRAGAETPGVEIHMVSGRLFHVSGTVTDSQGRAANRMNGTLFKRTTATNFSSSYGFTTDEQGRFQMRNIAPGNYRLAVRQIAGVQRNADGSPAEQTEFANLSLAINADVDDLLVTTSPGVTITGTVVFENGPPQLQGSQQSFQMRVSATAAEPEQMIGGVMPQPAVVTPDLTFTMKGLVGEILLRSNAPSNILKSVQLGGDDITDTPHEFKNGDRVTLVMTSRGSTVEGTVTDATGKPVTDATLMLFSDDRTRWRPFSVRTRRGGVEPTGHFRLSGVLAGTYYLIALPRDRANALLPGNDPSVFEMLAKEATSVVVGEDEQRQVDVKVSGGGY